MKTTWIYTALFAAALLSGQEKRPDLTGTLTFQVDSPGGRIQNLIVTIGDGGTSPYKAVSRETHPGQPMRSIGRAIWVALVRERYCQSSPSARGAAETALANFVIFYPTSRRGPNLGGAAAQAQAVAGNAQQAQAPGAYGNTNVPAASQTPLVITSRLAKRYAPYAPAEVAVAPAPRAPTPIRFHGPVAFLNGGPSDIAYNGAVAAFAEVMNVPALLAFQDVGHYPGTSREPNGGAFAIAVNAWFDWTLKGNQTAAKMFAGPNCGLCADPKWHIQTKNLK